MDRGGGPHTHSHARTCRKYVVYVCAVNVRRSSGESRIEFLKSVTNYSAPATLVSGVGSQPLPKEKLKHSIRPVTLGYTYTHTIRTLPGLVPTLQEGLPPVVVAPRLHENRRQQRQKKITHTQFSPVGLTSYLAGVVV